MKIGRYVVDVDHLQMRYGAMFFLVFVYFFEKK